MFQISSTIGGHQIDQGRNSETFCLVLKLHWRGIINAALCWYYAELHEEKLNLSYWSKVFVMQADLNLLIKICDV